jgi:5'-nucleotidase
MTHENLTRREFAAVSAAAGAAIVIGAAPASAQEKTMHATFTILHTNDIHSNLIGVGPASDYTPATLNDDRTVGGIERIATLIVERRRANEPNGPVLVLDIGDVSIGTAFGGATQETGAELQCLTFAGYDATTFGNHDFDFGPAWPRECGEGRPQRRWRTDDTSRQHKLRSSRRDT